MKHETAAPMIGDLLHGRLTGETRDEVLTHVVSCAECRSLTETYELLSEALIDDGADHPSAGEIVRYALDERTLSEEERDRIATHLLGCELCASELDVTSRAEAELTAVPQTSHEHPASGPDRRSVLAPAVAAAAVLVVMAYPTYLGLFEVPRIDQRLALLEAERSQAPAAVSPGPYRVHYLEPPLRDLGGEMPEIVLADDQTYAMLGVVPGLLEDYAGAGAVWFDIRDASGRTTWSLQLDESELSDVTAVLTPADRLPSGELTLVVSRGADRDELVFETPFRVVRSRAD